MLLSIDISIGEISIDKDRCMTDTVCLLPQHCTNKVGSTDLVLYDDAHLNISTDCNVMFQLKPFTEKKYLVTMQVTSDEHDLDTERGITLLFGTQTLSFCSETVSNMSTMPTDNIISMQSGTNIVTNSTIQCAQFIIGPDKNVSDHLSSSSYKFTLSFSRGNDTDEKYVSLKTTDVAFIDIIKRIGCDPDKVDSSVIQQPSDVYLTTIPDTIQPSFDCSQRPGHSTYVKHGGQLKQVTDLKCEKNQFTYALNEPAEIPAADKFNVYCGVPVCSMCTSIPAYNCSSCSAAVFHASTNGSCSTLSCPGNRWIYNSGDHITGTPTCKRSNSARGGYVWLMEKEGQDIEMHKGACSQQYDCATTNPLKSECNSTGRLCAVVRIKDPIKCSASSSKMIVETSSPNRKTPKTSIACDESSGKWYADGNKTDVIAKGSNVYCEPDVNSTLSSSNSESSKKAESDSTVYYIGGGGALLLLLVIIGGIVGFIWYRGRNKKAMAQKEKQLQEEERRRKEEEAKYEMEHLRHNADLYQSTEFAILREDEAKAREQALEQQLAKQKAIIEEKERLLKEKTEMEAKSKSNKVRAADMAKGTPEHA